MAADRRARDRKLIKHPELCKRVIERIKDGWAPEQIGNRMIQGRAKLRVCQETIYRYIYSKDGMRDALWWYLPTHRVAHRRQFGHSEVVFDVVQKKLARQASPRSLNASAGSR